jgi:peptidoglycan hydrolase CwlO-like protein
VRRRSLVVTIASMAAAIALVTPQLAGSAPSQDPRAERERVRAERAEVAAEIDTNKASRREIEEALQTLQANLNTQEAALARTEAEVAQAEQDIADAQAAITTLESELVVLRQVMRDRAVAAYVSPPADDILTVLETEDFTTAASRKFYIELRAQDDADVADRLEGATVDLDYQKRKATEARERAETKRAEQAERTQAVRDAKAQEQAVADRLSSTINSQVARSVELAKTDRALSAEIAAEQAALAAMLAAREEAARAAAAAAAAAANRPTAPAPTPAPSNQDADGGENAPLPPTPPPASSGSSGGSRAVPLCTVGGITVNCAISGALGSLLNAARASGLSLSGGGYRDPSSQIALRRAHCGSSYYAIYEMPASQCRPPTARPGQSQHELGLAVDFNACQSRSTACYRWLAANAASYGFYNLPSEPWHWSSTGR